MSRPGTMAVLFAATTALALVPSILFGQSPKGVAQGEPAELAGVLKSDAAVLQKAMACRRLAVVGNKDAVPALASLLADGELAAYARGALEAIPDPAADEALRDALGRLEGNFLVGALDSIGKRRDPRAIDALAKLLAHRNPTVVAGAARALGAIGNARAAEVLHKALADSVPGPRTALAGACLICADRLVESDLRERAVALLDAVRKAGVPKHLVLAATHRAIVARGRDGLALLAEELAAGDEARFRFGLQAARDLGGDACGVLMARFDQSPAPRQVLLLIALADIGDRAALPTVLQAARQGAKEVRAEAIQAAGRIGDPSVVPALLDAAVERDAEIARAAREALSLLKSDEINAAIAKMLDGDEPRILQVAATMAGQRGIAAAAPALLKLAGHGDAGVRQAAVKSLGATIPLDDLPKLIALAVASPAGDPRALARDALKAACARLPREACVERLAATMAGATIEAKVALLEHIAAVGGPKALGEVVAAARAPDDALQDAATRLLGAWMTADAAPALFDLAKTPAKEQYRVRALRGYLRIARQLSMTPDERLEVCRNALAIARRNEEKVLALEVLGRVGSPAALALAASFLADKELQGPACSAIVAMADASALTAPEETEKALARVLALTAAPELNTRAEKQMARARQLAQQRREETQFVPLFDGRTLDGWEGDRKIFRVEEGAIVGGSLKQAVGRGNDFLCAKKKKRGNFELRLQFKLLGEQANGGVNLRSKRNPDDGVAAGYQADLGAGYWGCLYDEARRNRVLAKAVAEPVIRADDWNDYRIRCEGPRIQLWINGTQTVDYVEQDAGVPLTGILALQVQANRPSEAWYRNIRIRELP